MKFVKTARLVSLCAFSLLVACGGGGSGGGDVTSNSGGNTAPGPAQTVAEDIQIFGAGVKGPLAFADTRIYRLDTTFPEFYDRNAPVSSAITNGFAQISGLSVPVDMQPPFILTIGGSNAIDLNTSIAPVIQTLVTVITQEMLTNGQPVYATPLTTMAFQMARHGTGTSSDTGIFLQQLATAATQIEKIFSIDQTTNIDIFRSPVVINSSTATTTEQKEAVYHRAALEAFAAKVSALSVAAGNVSTDLIIDRLALDLESDGIIDNAENGNAIGAIDPIILGKDPMRLVIPNTQYRIKDVMNLMEEERTLLGTAATGPSFNKDRITLPIAAVPAITPYTFPANLQGTAPEEVTVVMNANKPVNADTAIVMLAVLDADFSGEGELIINGNAPIALFGPTATATNDRQVANVPITTPASFWNDGDNTLVFRHTSTAGFSIQSATVSFQVATPVVYAPIITLSTTNIQFGNQGVGGVAGPKFVKFTNSGNAPLTISAISISLGFSQTNDCNNYLPVNSSCTFNISFTPISGGSVTGTMVISEESTAKSYQVNFSGTGSIPPSAISDTSNTAPTSTPAKYLSEDFESANWANRYDVLGALTREGGVAARTGSYGLRINVSQGEHWGGRILFNHARHGQTGNFNEIWTRYYVRFGPNWSRNDERIGKAGFRVRSDEVCNAPCLEMTDSNELTASGMIAGYSYFHRNVTDADIAAGSFSYSRRNWVGGERDREQWYCMETHHILNTPGRNNGTYQNWVGGVLVSDQRNIRQRDSATFDIDSSVLIVRIGGDWLADRDMNIYFDDWAVSDKRIGCQ